MSELMKWISAQEQLPEDGQAVLVRRKPSNWSANHTLADGGVHTVWRWMACRFVRGRTEVECKALNLYRRQDQHGNNLLPYCWKEFGPTTLFGQEVSHWAAITNPIDFEDQE